MSAFGLNALRNGDKRPAYAFVLQGHWLGTRYLYGTVLEKITKKNFLKLLTQKIRPKN